MASIWGERKRRNVYNAGVAYVIVAWLDRHLGKVD